MQQLKDAFTKSLFLVFLTGSLVCINIFLVPMISHKGQLISTKSLDGGLKVVFKKINGDNATLVVPKDNAILQGINGSRLS
jgi:hypothetical protein